MEELHEQINTGRIINEMINYFKGDVRRINHALKVYSFAQSIGGLEKLNNNEMLILETAAILHDIGIKNSEKKYNSSSGKYQELEGPPVAKSILQKYTDDEEFINRVCYLIGNHHSYSNIQGTDFQILVEADFLVNIYEDNVDAINVSVIKEKIFKTASGTSFIESMYLDKQ